VKVLFYQFTPFAFTHGGLQIQIAQTRQALERLGVEVEYLRWWDDKQIGDVLHFFGRMPTHLEDLARDKAMKVVVTDLLTEQGSRSAWRLKSQKFVMRAMAPAVRAGLLAPFHWESYRRADACVALTSWEAHLMADLFGARPEKTHVVPNGVEELFFERPAAARGKWLVCSATITERKRVLELAEAAVQAGTPLWVIGKPYSESHPYARRFLELARRNTSVLRYEGAINDRATLAQAYREARGFVLLSAMESLSLSALEAAACECPLLLSDLPWARTVFGNNVSYCPITGSAGFTAKRLKAFYDAAPDLKAPPKPMRWMEVGAQLKRLYQELLDRAKA
jgi:glycosyltransferase involved in cell wall biosynthesis